MGILVLLGTWRVRSELWLSEWNVRRGKLARMTAGPSLVSQWQSLPEYDKTRLRAVLQALSPAWNSEPPHPVLQRRTLDAESGGRAFGPGDSPTGLLENSQNLSALAFVKASPSTSRIGDLCFAVLFLTARHVDAGFEITRRYIKHGARRHDHSTFNHVLQFANIA